MDAIISHGCFLHECSVEHSIVGVRSRLDYGVELKVIMYPKKNIIIYTYTSYVMYIIWLLRRKKLLYQDTMMMGADYYLTESESASLRAQGKVPIGVGCNSKIRYDLN